jgi:peptidoglycan/LPS O-acetylase OafA/YrhL
MSSGSALNELELLSVKGVMLKPRDKRVFDVLDTMRGLAALVVVWSHLTPWIFPYRPLLAGVSVDLFFAISGFVISHSYEERLFRGWSLSRFLQVRLIRLYPTYLLGVMLSVAFWFVFPIGHDLKSALFQTLMLPYPLSISLYPLNGPAWSLMFELIINLIYALSYRVWTARNTLAFMGVSAMALLICTLSGQSLDGGWNWKDFPVGLARVAYGFAAGVFMFRLYSKGERLSGLPKLIPAFIGILPAIVAPPLPELVWRLPIILVVIPVSLFCAVCASTTSQNIFSLCLGRLSYPLYALHYPCLYGASIAFSAFQSSHPLKFAMAFMVCMVLVALSIEATFDRPVRQLAARSLSNKRAAR